MTRWRVRSLGLVATIVTAAGLLAAGTSAAAGTGAAPGGTGAAPGGTAAAAAGAAVPGAGAAPVISASSQLPLRRFVAAGTRAYVVGAEDGTFPPIGWHITGQMGGVWAPPAKLLDGMWFRVGSSWLDSASTYTSGPGFVRLTFPVTGGLRPVLTEFAPDGLQAALFGLTLVPADGQATTVSLAADAHSQIAAAYPWSGSTPTFGEFNHPNTVSAGNGVLQFGEQQTNWYADVGASVPPGGVATGDNFWGPTPADQQSAFGSNGRGGELTWSLPVPAGGTTLWLGVSGSQAGPAAALSALHTGLADPAGLLQHKIAERDAVAAQTDVQLPDAGVQQALLWSKLNLADMRRTITDAVIRDTKAGTVYPAPLATVQKLSGIDAAYPDYAEFFGTDGAYSSYGLAASGQWQPAIDQLNSMRTVSQIVNGGTGKVVHEVMSTGDVYYGDNAAPGDINETAQFAIAAGLIWKWSGDSSFLRANYDFIKAGEHYLAGLATGPDKLWPVGDGIVENPALGGEPVDAAAEMIQSLGVLHDMAVATGDSATASWAAQRQHAMQSAFDQWWIASQHLYADSLCVAAGGSCSAAGDQLQQRWWTSIAPMEQGIAPADKAAAALGQVEGPAFTGSCGLFVNGVGGPSGVGGQTCYLLGTGALAVSEANYGRTGQAVSDLDKVASQLTVEMPGSLPELAASAQYDPFEAFTSRANVMQAWSSYGLLWTVVNDLLGVSPDIPARTVSVVPEVPAGWPGLSVRDLRVGAGSIDETVSRQGGTYTTTVTGVPGPALTIGAVLAGGAKPQSVTLNGSPVPYQVVATSRGQAVEVAVPHPAGTQRLTVRTAS
ncbi:MAG TPA: hypothetical protein VE343_01720 [Streptosporangiaceae bacterium]|nr:hypothetical protein [Streptosporangiaceae bacterium]